MSSYFHIYKHIEGCYNSKLSKISHVLNESNYQLWTITAPSFTNVDKQEQYLIDYIANYTAPHMASLEYTSHNGKAKGWHLHIISVFQPPQHPRLIIHRALPKGALEFAIKYLAKQTKSYKFGEKHYFYNCGNKTRELHTEQPLIKQLELDFNLLEAKQKIQIEKETLKEKLDFNLPVVTIDLGAEKETLKQLFSPIYIRTVIGLIMQIGSKWMRLIDEIVTDEVNAIHTRPP